jgi:hypothetical protein
MLRWAPAIVASGLCAWASAARAQPSDTVLSVREDHEGCIGERSLRARVGHWLKRGALPTGITVVVDAASQPVSFSLSREGRVVAERSFELLPDACKDRLDAVALAVALAIEHATAPQDVAGTSSGKAQLDARHEPTSGTDTTKTETTPKAETAPKPEAAQTKEKKPAPEAPKAEAPKPPPVQKPEESPAVAAPAASAATLGPFRLHAGGAYLVETLPSSAAAMVAGVERTIAPHIDLGVTAMAAFGGKATLGAGSAHPDAYGARALLCTSWHVENLDLEGCAGAAGGVAIATGENLTSPKTATMAWLVGWARAALVVPAQSAVSVRFALDGLVNAVRPELHATPLVQGGTDKTATAFPLGAAASIELRFALP